MERRAPPPELAALFAEHDRKMAEWDYQDAVRERKLRELARKRGEVVHKTFDPNEPQRAAAQPQRVADLSAEVQQRWDEWLEARLDIFARDVGREIGVAQKEVLAEIKKTIKRFSEQNIDPTMRATVRTLRAEMRAARFQVKPYRVGERCAAGEVVVHGGGCYQAQRDTSHRPGHGDWICLAAPGERGIDGRDVDRAEIEDLRRRIGELEADIRVRDAAAVIDLPDWRRRGHG